MEATQATSPAPAQVTTPVHPIHQEQDLHQRMLKVIQETPDNDPHVGTDLEEVREQPETTPVTEAPENETPEKETGEIEIDEETPLFDIEYKTEAGTKEPKKLSLKELKEGFLAKQDYHRNIQKVKQQERELQEQVKKASEEAQTQYLKQLETYKQAVIRTAAPELQDINWNKLANEDPAEFVRASYRANQITSTLQAIEAAQKQELTKMEAERKKQFSEAVTKARQTLEEKIPGWNDEKYQEILKAGVQEYGFTPDEVAQVVDPRVIELIHDASQYRSLKKAKPEVEKKVVAVPKVIKPGSAEKPNPSADAESEARKRLRKSGDWRDAAQVLIARNRRS